MRRISYLNCSRYRKEKKSPRTSGKAPVQAKAFIKDRPSSGNNDPNAEREKKKAILPTKGPLSQSRGAVPQKNGQVKSGGGGEEGASQGRDFADKTQKKKNGSLAIN